MVLFVVFRPLVLCLQNVHIIRKLLQRFGAAPALVFEMDLSSVEKDAVNLGEVFLLSKGYKNASVDIYKQNACSQGQVFHVL